MTLLNSVIQSGASFAGRAIRRLGLSLAVTLFSPLAAVAEPLQVAQFTATQRLMEMFSPEIQATVNACVEQGKVNLAAGAAPDGSVVCGDGSPEPAVAYTNYVNTVSDILAASALVGVRAAISNDPRVSPEMITAYLASAEGNTTLRNVIEAAIQQNQLFPAESTESVTLLSDAVMQRLVPTLSNPNSLTTLLGTSEQYAQVVSNFCTAPGMSVSQAQSTVPGLSAIQLYAICIQESGVADEMMRSVQ